MLLIIATAVRAKTARLAKWSDIDLEARTWTPPLADQRTGNTTSAPLSYRSTPSRSTRSALAPARRHRAMCSARSTRTPLPVASGVFGGAIQTGVIRTPKSFSRRMAFGRLFEPLSRRRVASTVRSGSCRSATKSTARSRLVHSHGPGRGASRVTRFVVGPSPRRISQGYSPAESAEDESPPRRAFGLGATAAWGTLT